jgi:predicted transcriptional regulator
VNLRVFFPFFTFKYRDRATIIADILASLVEKPDGKRKTNIKQSANLSSDLLNKYIDLLLRNGYIMINNGDIYRLTQRGLKLWQNLDFEYLKMRMKV